MQTMPGFYMESYTGLQWAKREYSLPQTLSLVCQNVPKEVLLTGLKIQPKIPTILDVASWEMVS